MGIRNPLHAGFLGVRRGTSKPAMNSGQPVLKCPKEGCWKPNGHAPKTHGTQAGLKMSQRQGRQPVVMGVYNAPHSPRVVNPRPHDQFGRRVITKRLRAAMKKVAG